MKINLYHFFDRVESYLKFLTTIVKMFIALNGSQGGISERGITNEQLCLCVFKSDGSQRMCFIHVMILHVWTHGPNLHVFTGRYVKIQEKRKRRSGPCVKMLITASLMRWRPLSLSKEAALVSVNPGQATVTRAQVSMKNWHFTVKGHTIPSICVCETFTVKQQML